MAIPHSTEKPVSYANSPLSIARNLVGSEFIKPEQSLVANAKDALLLSKKAWPESLPRDIRYKAIFEDITTFALINPEQIEMIQSFESDKSYAGLTKAKTKLRGSNAEVVSALLIDPESFGDEFLEFGNMLKDETYARYSLASAIQRDAIYFGLTQDVIKADGYTALFKKLYEPSSVAGAGTTA